MKQFRIVLSAIVLSACAFFASAQDDAWHPQDLTTQMVGSARQLDFTDEEIAELLEKIDAKKMNAVQAEALLQEMFNKKNSFWVRHGNTILWVGAGVVTAAVVGFAIYWFCSGDGGSGGGGGGGGAAAAGGAAQFLGFDDKGFGYFKLPDGRQAVIPADRFMAVASAQSAGRTELVADLLRDFVRDGEAGVFTQAVEAGSGGGAAMRSESCERERHETEQRTYELARAQGVALEGLPFPERAGEGGDSGAGSGRREDSERRSSFHRRQQLRLQRICAETQEALAQDMTN